MLSEEVSDFIDELNEEKVKGDSEDEDDSDSV